MKKFLMIIAALVAGIIGAVIVVSCSSGTTGTATNTKSYASQIRALDERCDDLEIAVEEKTQAYTHHFDVIILYDQLNVDIPANHSLGFAINFNVISNNPEPYETLGDMDGDGYIISAFGSSVSAVFPFAITEAKLVYNGSLLLFFYSTDNHYSLPNSAVIPNMGDYPVEDSVTPI